MEIVYKNFCSLFQTPVKGSQIGSLESWDNILDGILTACCQWEVKPMNPCQQTVTGSETFLPSRSLFAMVIFPPMGWFLSHLPRTGLQFLGESCLVCVAACSRLVSFPSSFLGSSLPRFLEMADTRQIAVLYLTEY